MTRVAGARRAVASVPPRSAAAPVDRSPWAPIGEAVTTAGGRLEAGAGGEGRTAVMPGLPAPLAAALSWDLATVIWTLDLGPGPAVADGWVVPLAAAQAGLRLSALAAAGQRLVWLARQPVAAGAESLAAGLPLLVADAAHAWGLAGRQGARHRVPRRDVSMVPDPAPHGPAGDAAAHGAVAADLGDLADRGWRVVGRSGAWRLVPPPGDGHEGPPAFRLSLDGHTLRMAANVQTAHGRGAAELSGYCLPAALGRFLLAHNVRQPARLRPSAPGEPPAVWVEHAVPLSEVGHGAVATGLTAVAATYDAVHRELAALCDPAIAALLDLCESRGAVSAEPIPPSKPTRTGDRS